MRVRTLALVLFAILATACGARITIRFPIRIRVGRPTAAQTPTPAVVVVLPFTPTPTATAVPTVETPIPTPPPASPTRPSSPTATAAPSETATPTITGTRAPATPVPATATPSPTSSPGAGAPTAEPATAVPTPPPRLPSATGAYAVRFHQLRFSVQGEYVQIVNRGPDQDLSGWRLASAGADQEYAFPDGYILRQGETVTVHSGSGDIPSGPGHLLWTTERMWGQTVEEALLYDGQGRLVDRWPRR